jgi:cytochrome c-type biogenesis protein CcmE
MMNPARKKKLLFIVFIISILTVATFLMLYALRQNISLFFSPEQIVNGEAPEHRSIRIGGMVVPGSLHRSATDLTAQFDITDYKNTVHVIYSGVFPDLFREGNGVVAQGSFNRTEKQFRAIQILAKHDEKYMPPEVKQVLYKKTAKL